VDTIAEESSRADRDFDFDIALPYGLTIAAVDLFALHPYMSLASATQVI
jgi:hypothetical protein